MSALTTRGRAFLAAGITVVLSGFLLGFDSLMRVGILAVCLPLLTAYAVSRTRYRLAANRYVTPTRVSVGQTAKVTLSLANDGALPMGLLLLEDHVPYMLGTRARFIIDHAGSRWHQNVTYNVRSELRGHYEIGPLSIRVSDPFGLIELVRSFNATTSVVVIPAIIPLRSHAIHGAWAGAGENRPRAFASGSAEDVTVREYRVGDDLRRVHWRSSARVGELMVRREEQPWQSRASVLLDSRALAHQGSGPASSLEWAITAAASVSAHLAREGFAVRLLTDRPDTEANAWHDRSLSAVAQTGPILDQLAVIGASSSPDLSHATHSLSGNHGLVVAILGDLSSVDLVDVAQAVPHGNRGLAIVLETALWRSPGHAASVPGRSAADTQAEMLRRHGWHVTVARPNESVADAWLRLGHLLMQGSVIARSSTSNAATQAAEVARPEVEAGS
ncbi:MAG: DUF58 domain-containing protein [Nocardioidaceae bacterium]